MLINISNHPSANSSDEVCADCARVNKCQPCFEELVRRFQTPLLHFLIRRTGSRHEAEDLLQETYLTAYRCLHQYQSRWRFSTWIFTIANRKTISRGRRRELRLLGLNSSESEISASNPFIIADKNESRSKLWDTAERILEPDSFTAVWLNYVESMPANEIGHVLNRNANAVRILLHRAKQKLREHLEYLSEKPGAR